MFSRFMLLKLFKGYGHENTDSCLILTISSKVDSFILNFSGLKVNSKYKFRSNDQEFEGRAIFGPKMAHLSLKIFFPENPLIQLVFFIHVYLHLENQSQMLIR